MTKKADIWKPAPPVVGFTHLVLQTPGDLVNAGKLPPQPRVAGEVGWIRHYRTREAIISRSAETSGTSGPRTTIRKPRSAVNTA